MAGFGPGNILIRIGAEGAQAITEIERVNGAMAVSATRSERMGAALKKAAIPAAIALGAIAVGAKHAIDAAADLEKQVQKTNKVFGDNAGEVEHWSQTLAKSFGLSSEQALAAANKFGNMFVNLGYGQKASADMSKQMVQLASDLASFNNVPVDQVFQALQAGIGGATRGLKKYGIIIDANALKQEAMRQGLYDGKGALDAHAKSAATMALILQQTSKAQGDFARNSGDAANQQRVQAAEAANLSEELGKGLLPYYEAAQRLLISLTEATASHTTAVKVAIGIVAGFAAAILLANAAIKAYEVTMVLVKAATIAWRAAQIALNFALAANPIGLVIVAVAALGAALVLAYQHSQTFRNIVNSALNGVAVAARALAGAFESVYHAAAAAFDWIVAHWRLGLFAFGPIGAAIYLLVGHFNAVRNAATSAFDAIVGAINSVINAVQSLISWLGKIKVPSIHLPHVPSPFMAPPLLAPAAGGEAGARAATAAGYGYGTPRAVVAGGGGVTVNFYGPTDPEGAARALSRVLRRHELRQGRIA